MVVHPFDSAEGRQFIDGFTFFMVFLSVGLLLGVSIIFRSTHLLFLESFSLDVH